MILGDLTRVNQIDSQIGDLQQDLSSLYAERRQLLRSKSVKPTAPKQSLATAEPIYKQLSQQWQLHGVKLPALTVLKSRIESASQIASQLEQANNVLKGAVRIVAVPPFKTIMQATGSTDSPIKLVYAQPDLEMLAQATKQWQILVVINKQLGIYSQDFDIFMDQKEYQYNGLDCRALGLQELLASGLQTGIWPADNQWLLLLKDVSDKQILCAVKRGNQLTVDVDMTDVLLGYNYFNPAILVAKAQ